MQQEPGAERRVSMASTSGEGSEGGRWPKENTQLVCLTEAGGGRQGGGRGRAQAPGHPAIRRPEWGM